MESVANNETKYGVVPIENSIEGPVGITLDSLAHKFNLKIFKEIIIPINQNLIVNPGVKIEDIDDVYSHAQAIAQCQKYLEEKLPNADIIKVSSTSMGASIASSEKNTACICNGACQKIYNLVVIDDNIQEIKRGESSLPFIKISPS